ncbi:MAG: hypothetical protein EBX50_18090, partial [Chitinophagia bacterium]|nr:hypothetical protein [Chitinophagia bacterium]
MKKSILYLFLMGHLATYCQNITQLSDPVTNKNFSLEKYSEIKGSPFMIDKWIEGSVITPKGIYQKLLLKYNAYDNLLVFNNNEESFEFQETILGFSLMPKPGDNTSTLHFKNGLSGNGIQPHQFLQVLVEGNISLYKYFGKQVTEMSEINAGMVKTFTPNIQYYIGNSTALKFIKLNSNDFLQLMSNKKES